MKPLYKYSVETAKHDGELDAWRESRSENIRCRNYLDEQVREKFDGFRLPDECAENAIKEFGYDRTIVGGKRFAYSLSPTRFWSAKAMADSVSRTENGLRALMSRRIGIITNSLWNRTAALLTVWRAMFGKCMRNSICFRESILFKLTSRRIIRASC